MPTYCLYIDHQGHPAPLTESFHATASRRLSSAVARYPPSTAVETDSAYCRHCLAFVDVASATRDGHCRKATCQLCPICLASASIEASNGQCYYRCGRCEWTSLECRLSAEVPADDDEGSVDRLALARAAEELLLELNRRRTMTPVEEHFKLLAEHYESSKPTSENQPRHRHQRTASGHDIDGWSVEALERKLAKTKAARTTTAKDDFWGLAIERPPLSDEPPPVDASLASVPILSLQSQRVSMMAQSRSDLLPVPVPLRARWSRRCRAEIAEGRPGILLKPKLNPLEGDSSLRTGHGQWWKKDSSADHVMPRVRVMRVEPVEGGRALLLKVTNPTLGSVRLCLTSSDYQGESDWDDPEKKTVVLEELLVDTLTQTKVNAVVNTTSLKDLEPTPMVELLSAEDSIIELGGKAHKTPDEVVNWKPSPPSGESTVKVVVVSASTVWFELSLVGEQAHSPSAYPMGLEIEIGNGSWETSLIQPEGEADRVKWDLVIVI